MKNNNARKCLNFVYVVVIAILAASNVFAENNKFDNDRTIALVAKDLTARLKNELVQENLSLNLTKVEKRAISNNEVILTGSAFCVLNEEKTQLPISFEAKFNVSKQYVDEVKYSFLEGETAPLYDEDVITRHLLNQISRDHKTQSVVIAIDGFEQGKTANLQKQFKGSAEVKINEVEWKKIDFDVSMTSENVPVKIVYSFRK